MLLNASSSSLTKPWTHNTVAVLVWALAMKGVPIVPAAVQPATPRRTERLFSLIIVASQVVALSIRLDAKHATARKLRMPAIPENAGLRLDRCSQFSGHSCRRRYDTRGWQAGHVK